MYIPEPGPSTPQKSNVLSRATGRLLLFVLRWQIKGKVHNAPKFVMILAPHTSIWDFYVGLAGMLAVGLHSSWLISSAYTWWPLGFFLRRLGGIPIYRNGSHNFVSQIVESFNNNERMMVTLFPEGTRKKVERWRTGFWYIASEAEIPIQLISFDYKKRVTECGPVIEPSNNIEADMKKIQEFYKNVQAKYPEKFGGEYL
jgi:1-acyl-sn-glycerol-3-phosphate acyltransferase